MAFTRTLGRTHPLVIDAGNSASQSAVVSGQAACQNEELSLPQPVVRITFFGSLVSKDQCRREGMAYFVEAAPCTLSCPNPDAASAVHFTSEQPPSAIGRNA